MPAQSAKASPPASKLLVVLSFAAVYLIWGSTYFFIRIAVKEIPPFTLGAIRFLASGAIMLTWCLLSKQPVFSLNAIKHASVSGILMLFFGNGIVIWVEQYLESALVAILISSAPLYFVLFDKRNWRVNFSNWFILGGLIVGFTGVVLLFYERISGSAAGVTSGYGIALLGLLVVGSIAWTLGSLYSKYSSDTTPTQVLTAWQMLISGFTFLVVTPFTGEWADFRPLQVSSAVWASVAYLVLFGSIAAFSAYIWLLKVRSAAQVSTYGYVNPVVAVLLGVVFAYEDVSVMQIAGLVIILGSVLLINFGKSTKPT